jgi:hypothetical protein
VLIEIVVLLVAPSILLFLAAFVQLRRKRPEMERPYQVPGGRCGSWLWVVPPMLITLLQIWLTATDRTPVYNIPYFKMWCFVLTFAIGGLVHLVHDIHKYGARGLWGRITRNTSRRSGGERDSSLLFASSSDNPNEPQPKATDPLVYKKLYA